MLDLCAEAQSASQLMEAVTVVVKTLDGHALEVDVPASGTVKDIRSQLKQQYGLPKCALYRQVRTGVSETKFNGCMYPRQGFF